MGAGRLGEILVAEGLSPADLARGLAVARAEKTRIGSALVLLGLRTSDEVATALARQKGVAAARDKHFAAITPSTRALVSSATARRLCVVPVGVVRGEPPALVVAMRDPDDAAAIAQLARETGYEIRPAVACEARLRELIDQMGEDPPRAQFAAPPIDELTPPPRAIPPLMIELPELDALTPPPAPVPGTIDLTPITLDLPLAPPARTAPLAPVPPPARPIVVSTDLELDDSPRGSATPVPSARVPLGRSPALEGVAVVEEPSRGAGLPGWLVKLLLIGAAAAVAVLAWDYLHDDSPAPGTPLDGEFHCKRLDAMLTLPGAGWIEEPGGLGTMPKFRGDGQMRAALFSRGDRASPRNLAVLLRITMDGAFANITPEQFQAALDTMQQNASSVDNGIFTMRGGACTQDSLAGKPLGVCRGSGDVRGSPYDLRFLFWAPSGDDAIVLVYLDHADAGAALEVARSIKLD